MYYFYFYLVGSSLTLTTSFHEINVASALDIYQTVLNS